jgi:hypothetical protein
MDPRCSKQTIATRQPRDIRGIYKSRKSAGTELLHVRPATIWSSLIICKTVGSVAADQSGDDESYAQPQIPVP